METYLYVVAMYLWLCVHDGKWLSVCSLSFMLTPLLFILFSARYVPEWEKKELPNETPRLQQFSLSMEFNKRRGLRDELVFMV